MLLAAGADVDVYCESNELTALHLAAVFDNWHAAMSLTIDAEGNSISDADSSAAAEIADFFGHGDLARCLYRHAEVSTSHAPMVRE